MAHLKIVMVDLSRLNNCGEAAGIVVRLMMACNDIIVANQCLGLFKENLSPSRKHTQWGAKLYFSRLQCGHLREALYIIEDFRKNNDLLKEVSGCSDTAKQAFKDLVACLEDGHNHKKFKQYVEIFRHKMIFHYDQNLVMQSIAKRSGKKEGKYSTITQGDKTHLWRFGVADDICDSMVCREIWKIPENSDLRESADEIALWQFKIFKSFLQFCGDFIMRYIREHAAV